MIKFFVKYRGRYRSFEDILQECGTLDISAEVYIEINGEFMSVEEFCNRAEQTPVKRIKKVINYLDEVIRKSNKYGKHLYRHRN